MGGSVFLSGCDLGQAGQEKRLVPNLVPPIITGFLDIMEQVDKNYIEQNKNIEIIEFI